MNTKLEEVAKAIGLAFNDYHNGPGNEHEDWRIFVARAALLALETPSEGMLAAARRGAEEFYREEGGYVLNDECLSKILQAMLHAILEEKGSPE